MSLACHYNLVNVNWAVVMVVGVAVGIVTMPFLMPFFKAKDRKMP